MNNQTTVPQTGCCGTCACQGCQCECQSTGCRCVETNCNCGCTNPPQTGQAS